MRKKSWEPSNRERMLELDRSEFIVYISYIDVIFFADKL